MEKVGQRRIPSVEKSSYNFGWNQEPNCILLYPKQKRHYKFKVKLNHYWMNLHKN
jgi:hypothetical protein